MKRIIPAFLLLLLLSGCRAWVQKWAATPTFFPSPVPAQTVTPEPSPTFDLRSCLYVEDFRPMPDVTTTLMDDYAAAGFSNAEVYAEAYGQVCLDDLKISHQFLPRQTNIRIGVTVDSVNDLAPLGDTLQKLLAVLDAIPQDQLPGPDIGTLTVAFQAPGGEFRLSFAIDLGRRAFERGLSGEALVDVLR